MATESTNNSAAAMAANLPSKVDLVSIPGFGPPQVDKVDPLKYRVRYLKVDFDNPESLTELEILETKGLSGTDTLILNKKDWTFLDKYLMVVTYLEKITLTS